MNKICTTLEQSKKLLELGLNPETADMHIVYQNYGDHGCFEVGLEYHAWDACHVDRYIPCWSVGALLELIPNVITIDNNELDFELLKGDNSRYYLGYCGDGIFRSKRGNSLIDACFEMVCWLLENDYIKKGE